jgi:putative sterol carrier protein
MPDTIGQIVSNINDRMKAEPARVAKLAGLTATYLFNLSGEGGGSFHVAIANGAATIKEGTVNSPNVTVTVSLSDFNQITEGKLNPTAAFMAGKLKVSGDMSLAMKLQSIIG